MPGLQRRQLGRRAVLVGGADEQHLVARARAGSARRRRPAASSPTRLPRCLTPLMYGRALVIRCGTFVVNPTHGGHGGNGGHGSAFWKSFLRPSSKFEVRSSKLESLPISYPCPPSPPCPSMLRVAVKLGVASRSCVHGSSKRMCAPRAVRVCAVRDRVAFYPSSRASTRLPETVQFPPGRLRDGTLSVTVTRSPDRDRAHRTRETRRHSTTPAGYRAFSSAPAGTVPVVAHRHSAITSWRATATMPIRRARFPVPKRALNHCVRALARCHRTQAHAS